MNRKHCSFLGSILVLIATVLPTLAQKTLEIPAGITIRVRMIDRLSSEEVQVGDTFHGTLDEPIEVSGKPAFPKGADVMGRIVDVHRSGRLSEPGELDLALVTVSSGTVAESLRVEPLVIKGEAHTKSNATKIGGGAVLGAIIGGIAGGGKGAAVGTAAGAAAGTGAAAATGKKPAVVDSEAILSFVTSATGVVAPAPSASETGSSSPVPANPSQPEGPANSEPPRESPSSPDTQAPAENVPLFTLRDRRIIRNCVAAHASDFPPGATERPELPPGSDRQIRRGDIVPADVQRQLQSLPLVCEEQLPKLPSEMERVVYSGRVLLIDNGDRIADMFYLDEAR